jgi:hypothetical protein
MNFTLEELRDAVAQFPSEGHFYFDDEAIWYEFICDSSFVISDDNYECFHVKISDRTWLPITTIDSLEEINKSIASGEYSHFRYIALTN